ncbi:30S ribosomal protein S2 [Cryomorphaceae bacterium 1068]|nr:30S ribosomal protein S2 [Cryomorphaceae bacterium 1068]
MSDKDQSQFKEMLDAGVHFGHLTRKWNPNMAPYIFDEKKGIHIIDLNKTSAKLDEACKAIRQVAKSGKKILFVATKKQAKAILDEKIKPTGMPYITERWSGGMLTNFATVRKAIRKMSSIDKMQQDGTFDTLSKRERLQIQRQRDKLEKTLGGIAELTRLPAAIFIVDIHKEHIALAEAKKLNITTFGMVDTNSDPTKVEFPIPSNDDASKSIAVILDKVSNAIMEGMDERKASKDKAAAQEKKDAEKKEADKKAAAEKKAADKKAADKKAAEAKKADEKKGEDKKAESTEKAS